MYTPTAAGDGRSAAEKGHWVLLSLPLTRQMQPQCVAAVAAAAAVCVKEDMGSAFGVEVTLQKKASCGPLLSLPTSTA